MKTSELIATLLLPKLPKMGCRTARRLIRHFGSAEAVFQLEMKGVVMAQAGKLFKLL